MSTDAHDVQTARELDALRLAHLELTNVESRLRAAECTAAADAVASARALIGAERAERLSGGCLVRDALITLNVARSVTGRQ